MERFTERFTCRLADGTAEVEYTIDKHFQELLSADAEGRLLVLPCKVGDTVYAVERFCDGASRDCGSFVSCEECDDYRQEIVQRRIGTVLQAVSVTEQFNKTVFLTREEAEEKLREVTQ